MKKLFEIELPDDSYLVAKEVKEMIGEGRYTLKNIIVKEVPDQTELFKEAKEVIIKIMSNYEIWEHDERYLNGLLNKFKDAGI